METSLTYEKAYQELKVLAGEIENESVSVDVLAEKVKRASFLIGYCQEKLRTTEREVSNIIGQMNQSGS